MRTIIVLRCDGKSGDILLAFDGSDVEVIGTRVSWPGATFILQLHRGKEIILCAGGREGVTLGIGNFLPIAVGAGVRWEVKEDEFVAAMNGPSSTPVSVEIVASIGAPKTEDNHVRRS
jgi:hypothetical protein